MRRFLFFVNQPYSYSILRPLQAEILRRGHEVAWFVAGCSPASLLPEEKRLRSVTEVMEYGAEATFVPGDWVPYFFPGIKVEVFHGMARNKRGHSNEDESDHYRIRGWFDLYCTHAEKDTQKFQELARVHGHFTVARTGWPKLDPLMAQGVRGPRQTEPDDIPVVFFASTFSRSVTAAPALADEIEAMAKSGHWKFIVTMHPKMEPEVVQRYRGMAGQNLTFVESDVDLMPLLAGADVMLCDTSSIMFEFMFLDRPVVTFRTKMPGPYLLDVTEIGDLEGALRRALSRPPDMLGAARALCDDLHPDKDGQSSARVLDAVEAYLSDPPKLSPKPRNFLRKLKVRRRLRRELKKTG